MPTLLTNRKMSPALAARIEASVRGKRALPGKLLSPRMMALVRLTAIVGVTVGLVWMTVTFSAYREQLQNERRLLLEVVTQASTDLDPADLEKPEVITSLLMRRAAAFEGQVIEREAALINWMARPVTYIRGPIDGFRTPNEVASTASSSFRDAFVLCLYAPPETRSEKMLKRRVQQANAGGQHTAAIAHVERLHDALEAMPLLSPAWTARVRESNSDQELEALRRAFLRAPIDGARRVAQSDLLLFVMDEPKEGDGPTELDGACRHQVRVELVDLKRDKTLLRLRKRVDPSWVSEDVRSEFGGGINSCELALEVRKAIEDAASK